MKQTQPGNIDTGDGGLFSFTHSMFGEVDSCNGWNESLRSGKHVKVSPTQNFIYLVLDSVNTHRDTSMVPTGFLSELKETQLPNVFVIKQFITLSQ